MSIPPRILFRGRALALTLSTALTIAVASAATAGAPPADAPPSEAEPPARASIDAWPLLELGDDTTTILYPFYSQQGESVVSFPFYYRTNEGRDHHVLWPFVKVHDGQLVRAAPLYFAGENRYTFLPFIHRTEYVTASLTPPLIFDSERDFDAVLPFYARSGSQAIYLPWVYVRHHRPREGEEARVAESSFVPFYAYDATRDGEESSLNILGVNQVDWKGEEVSQAWAPPFYSYDADEEEGHLWVMPYYENATVKTVPLVFWVEETDGGSNEWVLAYHRRREESRHADALYPFFSYEVDERELGEHRERFQALWPLYDRDVTWRSGTGEQLARRSRFLIFTDDRQSDGTRTFRIFGLPIVETVEGEGAV